MRFLGIGDYCDLGALYLRLIEEGHEVKISIGNPLCSGTLAGLVEQTPDWRKELDWIRAAGTSPSKLRAADWPALRHVSHGFCGTYPVRSSL